MFSLNPATGKVSVLHAFGIGEDGENPVAELLDINGVLYGTTYYGGGYGYGTVFKLQP